MAGEQNPRFAFLLVIEIAVDGALRGIEGLIVQRLHNICAGIRGWMMAKVRGWLGRADDHDNGAAEGGVI